MKLSDLGKGYAALNAGDWIGNIPFALFDGVRFKVCVLWNPDFVALYETLSAENSDLSVDANNRRMFDECLVRTCLVGWDGVDDAYSGDTAAAILADPQSGAQFKRAIIWAEIQLREKVKAQIEADEKN